MTNRKCLAVAAGVLGLVLVGCEEKKAPPPAPKAAPAATGATGSTAPTTPPAAPK